MDRKHTSLIAKWIMILVGALCFGWALSSLTMTSFTWGYLSILVFSALLAPRMSIALPRSKFAISFSDALVFLTFLLYGGPEAIVVAGVETLANCLYLRTKGFPFGRLMIPTNVAISTASVGFTYIVWLLVPRASFIKADPGTTQHLIATLTSLAILQFTASSFLAAVFQSLKDKSNLFSTWRRDCFSSSMTQIVGAGLAGVVHKLVYFGDLVTGIMATVALGVAYLSYRQSINEVVQAIDQAE